MLSNERPRRAIQVAGIYIEITARCLKTQRPYKYARIDADREVILILNRREPITHKRRELQLGFFG